LGAHAKITCLRIAAIVSDGRTYRFSQKLIKDNFGVGYCVNDAGAHTFIVILVVGRFIEGPGVPVPVN
jgi:hypothetical protein